MDAEQQNTTGRQHLATVSFEGRFWDAYIDFDDRPERYDAYRAFVSFSQADAEEEPVNTTIIFIEPSYDAVMTKARSFSEHQLVALLRSAKKD